MEGDRDILFWTLLIWQLTGEFRGISGLSCPRTHRVSRQAFVVRRLASALSLFSREGTRARLTPAARTQLPTPSPTTSQKNMTTHDMAWDESRTGTRLPDNLISFPENGDFHAATRKALPWDKCGPNDSGRAVVVGSLVEKIFRGAPVSDPSDMKGMAMMLKFF